MPERSPAERVLARSFTQGRTRFNVRDLQIDHHQDRSVTMTYRLDIAEPNRLEERWEIALPWSDKSFVDVFTSPAPEPGRLEMLTSLVRSLLGEWWETKGYERQAAKMGRRLY
ncbi:hypothetical protein [Streptomyces ureilyticus]|uniref:Uncharacterized protein n=1 Tax=Streptomyces ureilyticus TaxID=1775131 RepID=A0ABX0DUG3_9ACTN|nr:hypothetical protein [Streptomyces ureilyticus]NGO45531.1 hypothetical protein [Streptomyces ureilyticus]